MGESKHVPAVVQPSWGKRLQGIEGLRGIAALMVLIHHVGQYLFDPEVSSVASTITTLTTHGLTLFFVLSGFLLYRPFVTSLMTGSPAPSIARYFRNRALRVYPGYLVIFLLVTFALGLANTTTDKTLGRISDPLTLLADLALAQTYIPATMLTGLGVAWSLTAEIAFYVILPGLFLGAAFLVRHRLNRMFAAALPAVLLIAVGLSSTATVYLLKRGLNAELSYQWSWGQTWTAVFDRSVVAQADLFGYGMLIAYAVAFLQTRSLSRSSMKPKVALGVLAIVAVLGGVKYGGPFTTNLIAIAAALVVLIVVLPGTKGGGAPNAVARTLDNPVLRYLGLISYSVYLWHVPVIQWLEARDLYDRHSVAGLATSIAVAMVISIALSSLTYHFVEKPALGLKMRTDAQAPVTAANHLR